MPHLAGYPLSRGGVKGARLGCGDAPGPHIGAAAPSIQPGEGDDVVDFRSESLDVLNASLAGRYRIERQLAAGGMAVVLLAEDIRHHRRVAIKVLHAELSALLGPDRFLREIELTANLQHPHILPLFDSGSASGLLYYVMPYVEGETLRTRLDRERQLPIAEAARIASEIADALDYAHRHGVIHRDVKPENVLLHEGRVLVADFGIARAVRNAGGARITETGISLGTPQYMSPEQATAEREVDQRSDIYSLGAVLYEMLAGEPPHTGPSAQAIIARVVTEKPRPVTAFRDTVPPALADIVHTALAKLPADRFGSAAEMRAAFAQPEVSARPHSSGTTTTRMRTRVGGAALIGLAAALGWLGARAVGSAERAGPPSRLALLTPALESGGAGGIHARVGLTPDGEALLFTGGPSGGRAMLNIQQLSDRAVRPIPGTELVYSPRVSPDGRWIAARDLAGSLVRIPIEGTTTAPVPLTASFTFFAWAPDGTLWATRAPFTSVERLSPTGQKLEPALRALDAPTWMQQVIDDGRRALVVRPAIGTTAGPLLALDLATGETRTVLETPVVAARVTAGTLVFARPGGVLLGVPFDERDAKLLGAPVTLAVDVTLTGRGDAQLAVSNTGTVAYIDEASGRSLMFVDRSGSARLATREPRNYHNPRFSPDGRRLSMDFALPDGRDVWVLDLEQETVSRVTFDRDGHDATWTPDGAALTYTSYRAGAFGIFRVRPGSGAPAESLIVASMLNYTGEWLPDGSALLTTAVDARTGSQDVVVVRHAGRGPIEPVVATPYRDSYANPSHDGRWAAYVSDQSGRAEVYVRALDGSTAQVQVSQKGGDEPVWSRDGRELFYRAVDEGGASLVAAQIASGETFRVVARQRLFPIDDYAPATPHASYDVSPDGRTFVFVKQNPASHVIVLQNVPELVKRLAATAARPPAPM
jgi:serine/threonine-protein kinase